ncbi:SDR family oxidoreductase [Streptomyces olivoreticuli]
MTEALVGKVCLVTGGAQGIGRAIGQALAQCGAVVHVADISRPNLAAAATHFAALPLASSVTLHHVDVTDRTAYQACIDHVRATSERLDVLVNNAAFARWCDVGEMTVEEAELSMRTGYDAMVYGVKAVLSSMTAAGGGHIVNMGSAAGVVHVKGPSAAYAAAKAAIGAYTRMLHVELADSPVHAMLVRPATVGGTDFFGTHVPSGRMPRLADFLPVSAPEDVAEAVLRGIVRRRAIVDVPRCLPLMYRAFELAPGLMRSLAARGGSARRDFGASPSRRRSLRKGGNRGS